MATKAQQPIDTTTWRRRTNKLLGPRLWLLLLLALTAAIYWSGLSGGFLFDDFANLPALGRYGGVDSWQTLLYYLTSGIADPTGRPVSMASFLFDARNWPAEPWPFKRTSLLVHLANGALLYSVLAALGRRVSADARRVHTAAVLATGFWLLAPLWVSTVLYIIQRQAMLAAFFVLAGIRLWVAARNALEEGWHKSGIVLALLAVPAMGLLAGLSKANGFLLPLLIATLELTVLRCKAGQPVQIKGRVARGLRLVLVWAPAALLLAWLLWRGMRLGLDGTSGRPWTLGQRLLSEPRALLEYLYRLWVPGVSARGVFADGFAVSKDAWHPWSTLPALALTTSLLLAGFALRKLRPVLAAAVLFYFAGHVMESSVVMLELYFEHRNYLPATLLFWPLAWWITDGKRYQRWKWLAAAGYLSIMALATAAQAHLWADTASLARVWALQNPSSARAQTYAATQKLAVGDFKSAERHLDQLLRENPREPQYALNLLNLRCRLGLATSADVGRAAKTMAASKGVGLDLIYHWLADALQPRSQAACSELPANQLDALLEAATTGTEQPRPGNKETAARTQRLLSLRALRGGHCKAALQAMDRRLQIQPRPEYVQTQVALLATLCGPDSGLEHLQRYLAAGAPVSRASSPSLRLRDRLMADFWKQQWDELEQTLLTEREEEND